MSPDPDPLSSSAHVPHNSAYAPLALSALVLAANQHLCPFAVEGDAQVVHRLEAHTAVSEAAARRTVDVGCYTVDLAVDWESGRSRAKVARCRRSIADSTCLLR